MIYDIDTKIMDIADGMIGKIIDVDDPSNVIVQFYPMEVEDKLFGIYCFDESETKNDLNLVIKI
jgi:hypothetical protein